MSKFFVRIMRPNEPGRVADEWQEIEAATENAAVERVCGFPVAEGANPAHLCAEARAGTKASPGRMYRRA